MSLDGAAEKLEIVPGRPLRLADRAFRRLGEVLTNAEETCGLRGGGDRGSFPTAPTLSGRNRNSAKYWRRRHYDRRRHRHDRRRRRRCRCRRDRRHDLLLVLDLLGFVLGESPACLALRDLFRRHLRRQGGGVLIEQIAEVAARALLTAIGLAPFLASRDRGAEGRRLCGAFVVLDVSRLDGVARQHQRRGTKQRAAGDAVVVKRIDFPSDCADSSSVRRNRAVSGLRPCGGGVSVIW